MMKKLAKSTANFNCLSKEEMTAYNSQFNFLVCIIDKQGKRVEELKIDNKYNSQIQSELKKVANNGSNFSNFVNFANSPNSTNLTHFVNFDNTANNANIANFGFD